MKIAICFPSQGAIAPQTAICRMDMSVHNAAAGLNVVNVYYDAPYNSDMGKLRNSLVMMAADYSPTHLLWVGPNVIFPHDALSRLIAHDKDIVATLPCTRERKPGENLADPSRWGDGGLQEAVIAPHDFCLVAFNVYEKLTYPYYYSQYGVSEETPQNRSGHLPDYQIFSEHAGYESVGVYCDVSLSYEMTMMQAAFSQWR